MGHGELKENGMCPNFRRIVIKVGTSLLTEKKSRLDFLKELVSQIKWLRDRGRDVVLVSSGAIGLGINELGLKKRPEKLPLEQAAAAVGQSLLMEMYHNLFKKEGITVAQVLLTQDDFRNRQRYLNAANTLYTLLELNVIPVINENDTVAVDELHYGNKFGDNDILASLVTNLLRAELLIILTDVEGLYKNVDEGEVIKKVQKITPEIEKIALGTKRNTSRGGMSSKLKAAHLVTSGGGMAVIASGLKKGVIRAIVEGKDIGTSFIPPSKKLSHRKLWLAFSRNPAGMLGVDEGAAIAILEKGSSLLPVGIEKVGGNFRRGDLVSIVNRKGEEIARGLVNFSNEEVEKIKGLKSSRIESVLGSKPYEEVIHRDNMVVL
jgi:glutamate 5-kinase